MSYSSNALVKTLSLNGFVWAVGTQEGQLVTSFSFGKTKNNCQSESVIVKANLNVMLSQEARCDQGIFSRIFMQTENMNDYADLHNRITESHRDFHWGLVTSKPTSVQQ